MGDKRPRGSSRGKRGARVVEDNAHRSCRSRHLSPMMPVSGGFVRNGEFDSGCLWSRRLVRPGALLRVAMTPSTVVSE